VISCAVPWATILPFWRKMIRSDISSISFMLCEVYKTLKPADLRTSLSSALILWAMSGSRLAVGSSRKRIFGSVRIALASASRVI
jgi:hypothetical protein